MKLYTYILFTVLLMSNSQASDYNRKFSCRFGFDGVEANSVGLNGLSSAFVLELVLNDTTQKGKLTLSEGSLKPLDSYEYYKLQEPVILDDNLECQFRTNPLVFDCKSKRVEKVKSNPWDFNSSEMKEVLVERRFQIKHKEVFTESYDGVEKRTHYAVEFTNEPNINSHINLKTVSRTSIGRVLTSAELESLNEAKDFQLDLHSATSSAFCTEK